MSVLKKGSFYLIISFLPLAANFLVLPFFTEYLSKTEYGILAMANVLQSYLTIFIGFGLPGTFSRFYYDYYLKEKLKFSLLATILLLVLLLVLIVGVLLFFFGETIFQLVVQNDSELSFAKYGFIIWGLASTLIFYAIIQAFYRNEENIKMFAFIALSGFFLMLAGSISGVIIFRMGALGSILGKLVGILILIVPYFIYLFSHIKFKIRKSLFKPVFKYALPLIPYLLLGVIMNSLDKQFVENYLGLEDLGVYNVAFMIGSVPSIFLMAAQSTVYPQIFKLLTESVKGNLVQVRSLISMLLLFTLLIVAGLISFIKIITFYFIGSDYQGIIKFVPIIALAFCFRALYVVMIIPIEFEKKSNLLPVTTIVGLVTAIIGGMILIPRFGLYGACFLIVLIQLSQLLAAVYFTYKIQWLQRGFYNQKIYYIGVTGLILITGTLLYLNVNNFNFLNYIPIGFVLSLFLIKIESFKKLIKLN
ncbi:MAG: oligosaccharide flippase family protein [bacterium]|nr:oligosaccharide flippase family protein [bacterium]